MEIFLHRDAAEVVVAEVLIEFMDPVASPEGNNYTARACGAEMPDSGWQGWIEFLPLGIGEPIRSGRETTQPNRVDTLYWATGLTPIYLEGALRRALKPLVRPIAREIGPPLFEGPTPNITEVDPNAESILNPFAVYRRGEVMLRKQLSALSGWHLVNIIRSHRLSTADQTVLDATPPAALVDLIVNGVKSAEGGTIK
ncbi:MAG: hypothetical protein DMF84_03605 [Acidobacteria bacterium]|nr:MAG: hypothetical protein DMF84_03605 [Acidobacteriota bacterium]